MDRRGRLGFGGLNLAAAAILAVAVALLPTRWWVVDVPSVAVIALLAGSALLLVRDHREAPRLARLAAIVTLVMGLALTAALALTASFLYGVYAQIGRIGAAIFGLSAMLALPWLVVLPIAELLWLGPRKAR